MNQWVYPLSLFAALLLGQTVASASAVFNDEAGTAIIEYFPGVNEYNLLFCTDVKSSDVRQIMAEATGGDPEDVGLPPSAESKCQPVSETPVSEFLYFQASYNGLMRDPDSLEAMFKMTMDLLIFQSTQAAAAAGETLNPADVDELRAYIETQKDQIIARAAESLATDESKVFFQELVVAVLDPSISLGTEADLEENRQLLIDIVQELQQAAEPVFTEKPSTSGGEVIDIDHQRTHRGNALYRI